MGKIGQKAQAYLRGRVACPQADRPAWRVDDNVWQDSCPVRSATHHSSPQTDRPTSSSTLAKLNPLNYIPSNLSDQREYAEQPISLPISRSASSIPRADAPNTHWEYPSPQQMYNAMLQKGYTDTAVDAVESMVEVHNLLNEGAWEELIQGGLKEGWQKCRLGEEGIRMEKLRREKQRIRREELGLRSRG
jgi:cytochrome c heme-lyase